MTTIFGVLLVRCCQVVTSCRIVLGVSHNTSKSWILPRCGVVSNSAFLKDAMRVDSNYLSGVLFLKIFFIS